MRVKCVLCSTKKGFTSIRSSLGVILKEKKFPYGIDQFETLNVDEYGCMNCGGSDRDRLLFLFLKSRLAKESTFSLLEFAPSTPLKNALEKHFVNMVYRTADLYMENVDDKVDICDMSTAYKDNSFDVVICSHILEHVESDVLALSELRRVVKVGGLVLVLTPIIDLPDVFDEDVNEKDVNERWRRFGQDDHLRLYSKDVFLKRINAAGLLVSEYGKNIKDQLKFKFVAINSRSRLYVCSKEDEIE
jgi:SAM-dependent methyltransferase